MLTPVRFYVDGTLFKTPNDGREWEMVDSLTIRRGNREVAAIAIRPGNVDVVYVGLLGRQDVPGADPGFLFKTTNGGRDWAHVGADVKDGNGFLVGVNALEIDPEAPESVFAATDVGVFRTTDGGAHWQPFNEGLPNVLMTDLAFVRDLMDAGKVKTVIDKRYTLEQVGDAIRYVELGHARGKVVLLLE